MSSGRVDGIWETTAHAEENADTSAGPEFQIRKRGGDGRGALPVVGAASDMRHAHSKFRLRAGPGADLIRR
eukprot:4125408-Pyramimonas_sp.AAC.1